MLGTTVAPLPPRFRRSAGGCEICKRRHVRCDKALPGCGRCTAKGLDCPGYDKLFRFVTGPRSRTRRTAGPGDRRPSTEQTTIPLPAGNVSIPTSLYTFGLEHPELCRQKHFLDHFFTCTAGLICLQEGPQNPFGESLKPYMQRSDALTHLVVAIGALHMANGHVHPNGNRVEAYAWHYRSRALEILRTELECHSDSQEVLMIMLLLGTTESWFNERNSASVHLDAAGRLLLQKLQTGQFVSAFMAHWLSFMEALSSFVSDREGFVFSSPEFQLFLHAQDATTEPDPLVGSWGTVMPLVGRVGAIIRRLRKENGFHNYCAGKLDSLIDSVETELLSWQGVRGGTQITHLEDASSENHSMGEAYRLSALLTLYNYSPRHLRRRASLVPDADTPAAFLSKMAQWTMEHLRQIPKCSKLWRVCSFPVLSAGQLLTDAVDRDFLRGRQAALSLEMQHASVTKIENLLHDLWRQRDRGYDIWWIDVLDASGDQMLVN